MSSPPIKKKPPIIAIVAVLVPLLAIAVGALVTSANEDDSRASSTTTAMAGDPAAEPQGSPADEQPRPSGDAEPTPSDEEPAPDDEAPAEGAAGTSDGEVASSPQTAGGEGDRPVVTWPQPTVPAGGCERAGGSTAVIVLRDTSRPACIAVRSDQAIEVQNRTGREISFMADSLNEIVAAGGELTLGRAADSFPQGRSTFWVQGAPTLSGLIEVG